MTAPNASDHYSAVFEALDAASAANACLAFSEARIQRALAHFRSRRDDPAALKQLEEASIELQRLYAASIANLRDERSATLERLRDAARAWIERLPLR